MGRGEYNVFPDIVLDYYVVIKKLTKLSDLKFKREKYLETRAEMSKIPWIIIIKKTAHLLEFISKKVLNMLQ